MTLRAGRGQMLTGQSKVGRTVIKRRGRPSRGCMALRAAMGELGRRMLRSTLICRCVTAVTIRRCVRVLPVNMTLHARHGRVSPRQREV